MWSSSSTNTGNGIGRILVLQASTQVRQRLPKYSRTLEFAETGGFLFASYGTCISVVFSLLDFVVGVTSAFSPSRRNRESSGWLPVSTSVLLSLLRSPRPHPLQNWRSSLGRRSVARSSTWLTRSARSNSRWRSESFSPCPWWKSMSSGSRQWKECRSTTRRHLHAVPCNADGVDARLPSARPSCLESLVSPRPCLLCWRTTCPPVLSVYIGNSATIGTTTAHVREVGNAALKGAHALGLKTHEFSVDAGNFELSGLSFSDTGLLGPWRAASGNSGWRIANCSGSATPPVVTSPSLLATLRHWPWTNDSFSASAVRSTSLQVENYPIDVACGPPFDESSNAVPSPHDIGPLCAVGGEKCMQWTAVSGVEERATRLWRANLSLRQGVSLNVGDSHHSWRANPCPS